MELDQQITIFDPKRITMGRVSDIKNLRKEIEVGRRDRANCLANVKLAVSDIRHEVGAFRDALAAENKACHLAWYGNRGSIIPAVGDVGSVKTQSVTPLVNLRVASTKSTKRRVAKVQRKALKKKTKK